MRYTARDASNIAASQLADGRTNPAYPAALQPRDRTRAASIQQVNSIANRLQPERLGASASTSEGAPIIGPDGAVESGNGRTMAIMQAYADGGPLEYRRTDIAADATNFFQVAHDATVALAAPPLAISLHEKKPATGEPAVITSDGTRADGDAQSLPRSLARRLGTEGLAAASCQDGGIDLRLCGTVNVQGRVSNGTTEVCAEFAPRASGALPSRRFEIR